jgi:hypothetical protein
VWVMLSRSGALVARGRLFDARDEVLSWFGLVPTTPLPIR